MPIEVSCPGCGKKLRAPDSVAGKRVKCPQCSTPVPVPSPASGATPLAVGDLLDEAISSQQAQQNAQQQAWLQQVEQEAGRRRAEARKAAAKPMPMPRSESSDSEGSGMGWVWFLLIFGLGNVILYLTTGWLLIPK